MNNKIDKTHKWLREIIIGLNLCPFAHDPYKNKEINITISKFAALEKKLEEEIRKIANKSYSTSLIIIDEELDFISLLDQIDLLHPIVDGQNTYQFIAFHPEFRFEGKANDARANLVNRSPFPMIHILKNSELDNLINREQAIKLSELNEAKLEDLTEIQLKSLFSYLNL